MIWAHDGTLVIAVTPDILNAYSTFTGHGYRVKDQRAGCDVKMVPRPLKPELRPYRGVHFIYLAEMMLLVKETKVEKIGGCV